MKIYVNGAQFELHDAANVEQLLSQLQLDPRQVAVELNETLIPRRLHGEQALSAEDHVEIVTLVGGG